MAPGCGRFQAQKDLWRLKRFIQLIVKDFKVLMCILFDDQAFQFAELSLKQGLNYHSISINRTLMKLYQMFQGQVYPLFESSNLIFVYKLCLVKLIRCLYRCNLVLMSSQSINLITILPEILVYGAHLPRQLELLLSLPLLSQFDFLNSALQHLGLLHGRLPVFTLT